jgi:hypothetical protein
MKEHGLTQGVFLAFVWWDWVNLWRNSISVVGDPAQISTVYSWVRAKIVTVTRRYNLFSVTQSHSIPSNAIHATKQNCLQQNKTFTLLPHFDPLLANIQFSAARLAVRSATLWQLCSVELNIPDLLWWKLYS